MLSLLHVMLERLHDEMTFDTDPHPGRDHRGRGVRAQARRVPGLHPHLHRGGAQPRHPGALCRRLLPRGDGVIAQDAGHAWAEAFVPELGWVGFDPANGICPTDAHVRVAVGLDYLGAAPLRGTRYGGGGRGAVGQGPRRPGDPAVAESIRRAPCTNARGRGTTRRRGGREISPRSSDCRAATGIAIRSRPDTQRLFDRHDLLLRNPGARRPRHDRRYPHQCGPRQHLDLPQAARLHAARRAHHGDRHRRQPVDQPVGREHAARGHGEPGDRRDSRR